MNRYLKLKKINMNIKNILIINYWRNKGAITVLILKAPLLETTAIHRVRGKYPNICDNSLWNIKISV